MSLINVFSIRIHTEIIHKRKFIIEWLLKHNIQYMSQNQATTVHLVNNTLIAWWLHTRRDICYYRSLVACYQSHQQSVQCKIYQSFDNIKQANCDQERDNYHDNQLKLYTLASRHYHTTTLSLIILLPV